MAASRVIRVPLVEESTRWAPPAVRARESRAIPAKALAPRADEAEAPLMFDLEGFIDPQAVVEPVSESARAARGTIERLLTAGPDDLAIHSAAQQAVQAGAGDLQATAAALQRMGWSTRVCSSLGGTLRQLRHTFLIATRHTVVRGEPAEWVVDPSFGQAFQVTDPTPRYAHILAAVPSLAVAPLPRLLRAVLTLGSELERCFERRGLPLPPWRSSDALASRYEQAAHSGAGGAATPAAAAATGIAAKQRQQAVKQAQQLERVQLRLLKLGLQPVGDGGDAVAPASPPSPLSDAGAGADSPTSVVQAAQGPLYRAFAPSAKAPEWVCCGWQFQQGSSAWRQRYRRRLAASAA
ncbi:hypothetical protein ABPG77_004694 [Micractinium sp. CCAP 211/92]